MADSAASAPARSVVIRATHWITTLCFFALLVSGAEIIVSHPRFYWGENGNFFTQPLFQFPIPASRRLVQTGFDYVLPDQNGWSRSLHFQSAWLLVFTALVYVVFGMLTKHFRNNLVPAKPDLSLDAVIAAIRKKPATWSYNVLQRLTYLVVIFILFPLEIWTGLAMSPAFVSAAPFAVNMLGGHQSARTIHFFVSLAVLIFLLVHVAMIWRAGFRKRVGAMIFGQEGL